MKRYAAPLLVLLLGFSLGWLAHASVEPRTGYRWSQHAEELTAELIERLELDEAQAARVRTIIDDARTKLGAVKEEIGPRFRAVQAESRSGIEAVLSPEQRVRFTEFRDELEAMRRRRAPEGTKELPPSPHSPF